jgi:hypothetical protein
MGRLIALIIGLAAIAFAVKYALDPSRNGSAQHTQPRQQLDNVREKSHDLERQMQKAADDAARNTEQR